MVNPQRLLIYKYIKCEKEHKMCEWNVFLVKSGEKERLMEGASFIKDDGKKIIVGGTFKETKEVQGKIVEIDSDRHEILISSDDRNQD
jgi:predicted RNA-binding protein